MAQVIVRNIEDEVIERLKLKAELNGHSLEQELREVIRAAAPLTTEQKLALIDRAHAATAHRTQHALAEDLIREDRDSR
jgi:plasmid stability protein